jgi:hypothetical protein
MIDLDLVVMAREILSPDLVDRASTWLRILRKRFAFQEIVPRLVVGLLRAFRI